MKRITYLTLLLPTLICAEEEVPKTLTFSTAILSVSAVDGKPSKGAELTIANNGEEEFTFVPLMVGVDAKAFTIEPGEMVLGAGKSETLKIFLHPMRGADTYTASLDVAEGVIPVKGVGLKAFEGKNEPTLNTIVDALAIPLEVGGKKLSLDTKANTIGDSLAVSRFRSVEGKKVRITPVARFSPPGKVPFGIVTEGEKLEEWGMLQESNDKRPDAHQCLFPEIEGVGGTLEKPAPDLPFAFYMEGHKYVSFTDASLKSAAPIPHTARVFPVKTFQGRAMESAYLIGFEEASNGDYQDAVFLIENVTAE